MVWYGMIWYGADSQVKRRPGTKGVPGTVYLPHYACWPRCAHFLVGRV